MERPESAPPVTEQNGLGEDSMTGFIRHCMDSILKPFGEKAEVLNSWVTEIQADLTKTTIKTDLNRTSLKEHQELLTGLRADLSETAAQANATQAALGAVKAEKAALEAEYQTTKAKLAEADGRLVVAEGAVEEVQRGLRETRAEAAKQAEAQAAADRGLLHEIRPGLDRLTEDLGRLSTSHREAVQQINKLSAENSEKRITALAQAQKDQRDSNHSIFDSIQCGLDLMNEKILEANKQLQNRMEHNQVHDAAIETLKGRMDVSEAHATSMSSTQASHAARIGDHDDHNVSVDKTLSELLDFRKYLNGELQARSVILGSLTTDSKQHAEDIQRLQGATSEQGDKLLRDDALIAQLQDNVINNAARAKRLEDAVGLEPYVKQAVARSAPAPEVGVERAAELQRVFSQYDKDGSGLIDLAELGSAMRSLGQEPSPEMLQDMIGQVDADGDGTIDFNEFCNMVSKTMTIKGSAEDAATQAFENMSLIARQKKAFQTIEEHTRDLRSQLGEIQVLKASALDHRLEKVEDRQDTMFGEVSKLRQGLELTQEYWKGLSNGLKETKRSVHEGEKMSQSRSGQPMSARGPMRHVLPEIAPTKRSVSRELCGMSDASTVCSPKDRLPNVSNVW